MDLSKYLPTPEMQAEFEEFKKLKTPEEKEAFKKARKARFDAKTEEEKAQYLQNSEEGLKATIDRAEEVLLIAQLGDLAGALSLSYIAKKYFNRSKEWLYQRLNGYKVNGKPAQFTPEERKKLADALLDISNQAKNFALSIN
ncbi:DUF5053 domain-containing protein [Parabacteroides pacaensis]|uniref:DUF5053 domain-containing protein n=1 Tax=Parabacteroides pacaensis TaxID=2086575 RepID=UPI001F1A1AD6|nr:DUF5053 domain-containing protein [Parabacteroides pacaensis]